jgi:hypothetical protein
MSCTVIGRVITKHNALIRRDIVFSFLGRYDGSDYYRYLMTLVNVPIHSRTNLVYRFAIRLPLVSLASGGGEIDLR